MENKLVVKSDRKQELGDLFGIFFEDLNHAADGGLYAELIQNRSFEFAAIDRADYHGLYAWEALGTPLLQGDSPWKKEEVALTLQTGHPVSQKNPHYLGMDLLQEGDGIGVQNLGFGAGIPYRRGASYRVTLYVRREQDFDQPLQVELRSKEGRIYAKESLYAGTEWKKFESILVSDAEDFEGRFAVTARGRGKVYLDFVSLFPVDTYKGRKNGVRKDLAELLEALHPRFMRFPGGCLIHDGSLDPEARDSLYRWKNTVGPLEERPARRSNWGYHQTLGLGFFEYFQLCEDLGAKPLPVVSGGCDPHHRRVTPLSQMQPWIDDALDLIEFANGSADSTWGRVRAEMGHPKPFGLEYIGVGNEEVGEAFFERFPLLERAIHEKYPKIRVIGTAGPFAAGGEYERGWKHAREDGADLVDEHYYMAPEWFLANHHRYDSFAETPKVFLGEYASWGNTWRHALAEASYMIGLERNAHAVGLACYAPLFCHVNYVNWKPDLIWFDQARSMGTVNYYVQQLFMKNQGTRRVSHELITEVQPLCLTEEPDRLSGWIGWSGVNSQVSLRGLCLRNEENGVEALYENCICEPGVKPQFAWECSAKRYTLYAKVTEQKGSQGFRIYFGWKDADNHCYWEVGGWQNQDSCICEESHQKNSCLTQSLFSVERGKTYSICLRVDGRRVEAWIDGVCINRTEVLPVVEEPLYVSCSVDETQGAYVIKAVNVQDRPISFVLELPQDCGRNASVSRMMAGAEEENTLEHPMTVLPQTDQLEYEEGTPWLFPERSVTVLRFPLLGQD